MKRFTKSKDSVLDYKIKWTKWLGTDTIATSTWDADSGITVDSDTNDITSATVWLSGGTTGETYCVKNTITTSGGRTEKKAFHVVIEDCEDREIDY